MFNIFLILMVIAYTLHDNLLSLKWNFLIIKDYYKYASLIFRVFDRPISNKLAIKANNFYI